MKANELRIGNWIEKDGKQYQISALGIFCLGGNHKPIPLTEDWLVKFGFEKGSLYFKKGLLDCVEISEEGRFNIYYGEDENNSISITYVHQLQNLYFALTGEELTIG